MITQEDLALEGYVGITVAYKSFNPNLGNKNDLIKSFRTHAYRYITNMMMTYCRKFSHVLSISERSAREEIGVVNDIGIVRIDHETNGVEFDIPVGSGVELNSDMEEYFFVGFSELERDLVRGHVIDGHTITKLSKDCDMTKSQVSKIIKSVMERMRGRAENYV
jgi:DNA-directed RNA polymerase specialized sigma subunit